MDQIQKISKAERELMECIWEKGEPVLSSELLESLPEGRNWKPSTVLTLLSRLTKKGLLETLRVGRAYQYRPLLSKEEYNRLETRAFVKEVYSGQASALLTALCQDNQLSREELLRLLEQVEQT